MTTIIRSNAEKGVADAFRRSVRRRPGLRKLLAAISKAVTDAGGTLYLAGGYPRDLLERKATGDVDLMVTGLGHRRLGALLRSLPAGDSGIRGIVSAGRLFPVYRIATVGEKGYVDASAGRSGPSSTRRGASAPAGAADPGALEDASRRDFTINSLLLPLHPGHADRRTRLLDFFGGVDDLRRKRIRCVGDPEDRFREDPVRMLRAVRFRNEREGFSIDPGTARAIRRLGPILLSGTPMERLSAELVRSLSANPARTIEDLRRLGLLALLLPEVTTPPRGGAGSVIRRYRFLARSIGRPIPLPILLANLFADLPPLRAKEALRRLRLPSGRKVTAVLSALTTLIHPERLCYPLAETEGALAGAEDLRGLIALYRATAKESGRRAVDIKSFISKCHLTPFFINGLFLVESGFPEGPGREEILLRVREASLSGEVRGRREAEAFARSLKGI
jgi:hypothetical protein